MSISSSNSSPICFAHWESGSAFGSPDTTRFKSYCACNSCPPSKHAAATSSNNRAKSHRAPGANRAESPSKAARPKATAPHRQIQRAAANAMLSPYEKRGVAIRATPRCIAYREQTEEAARPAPRERRRRCLRRSGRTCPAARVRDRTRRTHPARPRDAWERGPSRTGRRRKPRPIRR